MKDFRILQSRQVEKEDREFIEETSLEQFNSNVRSKKYPPGSAWFWALGAVFGPARKKDAAE